MAKKLPTIKYRKQRCVVDFRLGEMRCGKKMKPVKFSSLKGDPKRSKIKRKLRGLRSRTWHMDYIKGIDD